MQERNITEDSLELNAKLAQEMDSEQQEAPSWPQATEGGGWIDSPEGAYRLDPTLTGKATFGFVSKYKKGAHTPTGNTEFHFKAGDLKFHSSSYDWLVVNQNGENAQYKGSGTINGAGNYKFMLWASDKESDTFRIKIW